ncbi:peptidoglycan-binding domain-containing protein [Streptomyces virginiae]|uniref:peptidoglycan-binding domain-containing protein n=1 Tax=Streptomyces virginiae TaxID=1961 RepID=UPI0022533303|nr:peptidoglycan-binding domain-containing protein [Streptomyces virginiae]MCX5177713.1 peptidoglycan-binding protein [Streptomyces virginiae]
MSLEDPDETQVAQPSAGRATDARHRSRRGLVVAAVVLVLFGSSGSVWWIASQARTPEQRAANAAAPPPSQITGKVSDQQLVERMELTGKVETASRTTITGGRPQGTDRAVVTALPAAAGKSLKAGAVVAEVSGRPVLLLPGRFPAYRDLKAGDKGPDVQQLQRALQPLYGTAVNGTYGPATVEAVRKLYVAAGYEAPAGQGQSTTGGGGSTSGTARTGGAAASGGTAPRGGAETDGGTGAAPGSDGGNGTKGSSGSGGTGGASAPPARGADAPPAAGPAKPGEVLPAAEVTYVGTLPATVVQVTAAVGDAADKPLLVLGSGGRQVRAVLSADQRTRLRDLPADAVIRFGTGPYEGREGTLGSLNSPSDGKNGDQQGKSGGQDGAATAGTAGAGTAGTGPGGGSGNGSGSEGGRHEALFVPTGAEAKEGATQQIAVELRRSPKGSLTVPVSAVWTDLGGSSTVTVTEGGKERNIPVEVLFTHEGLSAVHALDENLAAGQTVVLVRRGNPADSGSGDGSGGTSGGTDG